MLIIEESLIGKNKNQSLCEDKIFKGKRFIAVIDGATSKDKRIFDGETRGMLASRFVKEGLEELDSLKENLKIDFLVNVINKKFVKFYKKNKIDYKNNPEERIVSSAVIYDNIEKKIIYIGDCKSLIIDNKGKREIEFNKKIDEVASETRSVYIQAILSSNKSSLKSLMEKDISREYILPLIKLQQNFQNKNIEYGYECFDGTKIPNNMINIEKVEGNAQIVLASDGYPKIFDTLFRTEVYLKKILKDDPLFFKKYKSTKGMSEDLLSFDDRSYISFNTK